MLHRIAVWTLSVGALATAAWAQPLTPSGDESARTMPELRGRIDRVDTGAQVVGLEDGRLYRVAPSTVVYADNQPVTLKELRPGQTVVIRSGEALALRDGQYVVVDPGATGAGRVTAFSQSDEAGGLRHTLYGRVEDIDNDGTVQIETGSDAFGKDSLKIRLSPDVARQLRKGDPVQLEVMLGPQAPPAASPRTR
jgi:hypothetical protein